MATTEKDRPKGLKPDELKVHGREACLALFAKRPKDIIRVYFNELLGKEFSEIVRHCVENRKAYHAKNDFEMEAISGSVHHEGICFVAKQLAPATLEEVIANAKGPLIWLDGVQNPQNIGAILRTAAHFGVSHVLGEPTVLAKLQPSAIRIAEGAAEFVRVVPVPVARTGLQALKDAGYTRVATTSHKGQSIYQYRVPEKTLYILGGEAKGVSKAVFLQADQIACIPGSGQVESLNVGVAAALCLGEYWRQHHRPAPVRQPMPLHRSRPSAPVQIPKNLN